MPCEQAKHIALIPIRAIVRRFQGTMVQRRANAIAQQQGLTSPGPAQMAQANAWVKNYVATQGGKFGGPIASLMSGSGKTRPSEYGVHEVDVSLADDRGQSRLHDVDVSMGGGKKRAKKRRPEFGVRSVDVSFAAENEPFEHGVNDFPDLDADDWSTPEIPRDVDVSVGDDEVGFVMTAGSLALVVVGSVAVTAILTELLSKMGNGGAAPPPPPAPTRPRWKPCKPPRRRFPKTTEPRATGRRTTVPRTTALQTTGRRTTAPQATGRRTTATTPRATSHGLLAAKNRPRLPTSVSVEMLNRMPARQKSLVQSLIRAGRFRLS